MRKQLLDTIEHSEHLKVKMLISTDETTLFAHINYDDGKQKATIEKGFRNNILGVKAMDSFIDKMVDNDGILDYFNLRK